MSTILQIRTAIRSALKGVHPRVWYERAPDDTQYPYLVFLLQNAVDQPGLEQFFLDVDGWDAPASGDTTALETLMDSVDQSLHKLVVETDDVSFVVYRDRRFPVEDDDARIRRRKHIYEVRTFKKRRDYHG